MELSTEQKEVLAEWVAQGKSLAEIQDSLLQTWKLNLTFMEVRFLIDDLDLTLQDSGENPNSEVKNNPETPSHETLTPAGAGVRVEVDKLIQPGSVVSGTVVFSDGERANWQLDQLGRLGLIPSTKGYKPDTEDFTEFQTQLQSALQKQGF